jgi:hypothetical protein
MTHTLPFESLSDEALLDEAQRLASVERHAAATLIACLVEVDARRLYLAQGCSSLFGYCTSLLRFSEHAAYARIEATRCARRVPQILDLLADGAITLTTVTLSAAHLTPDNQHSLREAVRGKSRREVERLLGGAQAAARRPSQASQAARGAPDAAAGRPRSEDLGYGFHVGSTGSAGLQICDRQRSACARPWTAGRSHASRGDDECGRVLPGPRRAAAQTCDCPTRAAPVQAAAHTGRAGAQPCASPQPAARRPTRRIVCPMASTDASTPRCRCSAGWRGLRGLAAVQLR